MLEFFREFLEDLEELKSELRIFVFNLKHPAMQLQRLKWWFKKIKWRIWNKRLKIWWYRLWIRKDESHCSLDLDPLAFTVMNSKERRKCWLDLLKRRSIAYERDLQKIDSDFANRQER